MLRTVLTLAIREKQPVLNRIVLERVGAKSYL